MRPYTTKSFDLRHASLLETRRMANNHYYIIEGPAGVGNRFGYHKPELVPAGKFVVVEDDEYINGGYGPCMMNNELYDSREQAESALLAISIQNIGGDD